MRKIYLTERDIHQMIKESVQTLLLEALTPDEIYNEYYSDIDKNVFDAAIAADPTSYNPQGEICKVGKYVKWILKLAKQEKWKPGDSFETKETLSNFVKHQKRLPVEQRDIKIYNSVRELYDILQPYLGIKSRSEIKQEEATKVYEDEQWEIVIPHTEKTAIQYGKGTKWCTAAENSDNMFDYYNNKGLLYINIDKVNNRKYQFHFESSSFMDEEDEEIQPNKLPWTEGALNYYKKNIKQYFFHLMYDYVYDFKNGIAIVELDGKENWFSFEKQEEVSPNQWFDSVRYFDNKGIAKVELNDKWNWFDKNKNNGQGGFVWDKPIEQWFNYIFDINSNGIAIVELNDKKYYFTLDGQFLDYNTKQPLSDEEVQSLQNQQQIDEMVNRLVRNYLR